MFFSVEWLKVFFLFIISFRFLCHPTTTQQEAIECANGATENRFSAL